MFCLFSKMYYQGLIKCKSNEPFPFHPSSCYLILTEISWSFIFQMFVGYLLCVIMLGTGDGAKIKHFDFFFWDSKWFSASPSSSPLFYPCLSRVHHIPPLVSLPFYVIQPPSFPKSIVWELLGVAETLSGCLCDQTIFLKISYYLPFHSSYVCVQWSFSEATPYISDS